MMDHIQLYNIVYMKMCKNVVIVDICIVIVCYIIIRLNHSKWHVFVNAASVFWPLQTLYSAGSGEFATRKLDNAD